MADFRKGFRRRAGGKRLATSVKNIVLGNFREVFRQAFPDRTSEKDFGAALEVIFLNMCLKMQFRKIPRKLPGAPIVVMEVLSGDSPSEAQGVLKIR